MKTGTFIHVMLTGTRDAILGGGHSTEHKRSMIHALQMFARATAQELHYLADPNGRDLIATIAGRFERDIEELTIALTSRSTIDPEVRTWTHNAPANCEWCGGAARPTNPIEHRGGADAYLHRECREAAALQERKRIEEETKANEAREEALRMVEGMRADW